MQRLGKTAYLLVALISIVPNETRADNFPWRDNLDAARAEAAQTGRLVLAHFWAPWCGPCKRLDGAVFSQPQVAQAVNANYVPVKLNADEHAALAKSLGIQGVPNDVIITPDGQVVGMFVSPSTAEGYVERMGEVAVAYRQAVDGRRLAAQSAVAGAPVTSVSAQAPSSQSYRANAPSSAPGYQAAPSYVAASDDARFASQGGATTMSAPQMGAYSAGSAPSTDRYAAAQTAPVDRYAAMEQSRSATNQVAANPSDAGMSRVRDGAPAEVAQMNSAEDWRSHYGAPSLENDRYATSNTAVANGRSAAPQPVASNPPPTNPEFANPAPANVATPPSVGRPQTSPSQEPRNAPPQPAGPMRFGLDGCCPVTLANSPLPPNDPNRWTPGDPKWGAVHRGTTYLFVGEAERDLFMQNPDAFAPVLSGMDPVLAFGEGQMVQGTRSLGVWYGGHIYLFSSEQTVQLFSQNPGLYAQRIRQAMNVGKPTTTR